MKVLEMITSTEATALMQFTNRMGPGSFRVGKVGRVYPDLQECKLININRQGRSVFRKLTAFYALFLASGSW